MLKAADQISHPLASALAGLQGAASSLDPPAVEGERQVC